MAAARPIMTQAVESPPGMPGWVTVARTETLEGMAFLSGAALATLHGVLASSDLPQALLRERLALAAAEACVALSGRPERTADLRDAIHLLRPGDGPGPAGEILQHWRQAVARPISGATLRRALPQMSVERISVWLDAGRGGCPVGQAAGVLEAVLTEAPSTETAALILADAALARALGWTPLVPLLSVHLKSRDLRQTGEALRLACHRAVIAAATDTVRLAADLTRRAARLRAVLPKLRAKGAGEAVTLFLSRDALAPSLALAGILSDRAARRLCERLVELGVVRELTGRDSFRLYGV
ncbi:MAG: DUF1403 family protein [Rhodobacteraceae bacterium]|nr:DUF1403 family protein [Paracoccaceae bacterium]